MKLKLLIKVLSKETIAINQILYFIDSETVCLRLLIKGLIVPARLCILSIAYY